MLIETYWQAGKRIAQEKSLLENEQNKQILLKDLSNDLGLEYTLVTRILKLYYFWPDNCPGGQLGQLSWGHYRLLLCLKEKDSREFYLGQAIKEKWSRDKLDLRIKNNYYSLKDDTKPAAETLGGTLPPKSSRFFVYKAKTEKVIDGDTIWASVDLGFNVWMKQKLRFRGINTAELGSSALAQEAKVFVEQELSKTDYIVLKSYREDKYGRYEADIYYLPAGKAGLPGEENREIILEQGIFLNQLLLDKGLAAVT